MANSLFLELSGTEDVNRAIVDAIAGRPHISKYDGARFKRFVGLVRRQIRVRTQELEERKAVAAKRRDDYEEKRQVTIQDWIMEQLEGTEVETMKPDAAARLAVDIYYRGKDQGIITGDLRGVVRNHMRRTFKRAGYTGVLGYAAVRHAELAGTNGQVSKDPPASPASLASPEEEQPEPPEEELETDPVPVSQAAASSTTPAQRMEVEWPVVGEGIVPRPEDPSISIRVPEPPELRVAGEWGELELRRNKEDPAQVDLVLHATGIPQATADPVVARILELASGLTVVALRPD